ncbi:MAG: cupin domain-containing protein [Acidobacteriota bacterium]
MSSTRQVDKPWGREVIWAETDRYVGKILVIRKGQRLSLQYHQVKEETLFVEAGRIRCESGPQGGPLTATVLDAGDVLHVPPGLRHRLEALEEARVFEVSTPEIDDVVREVDDFGRAGTSMP